LQIVVPFFLEWGTETDQEPITPFQAVHRTEEERTEQERKALEKRSQKSFCMYMFFDHFHLNPGLPSVTEGEAWPLYHKSTDHNIMR